jgi:hypothetical protein
MNRRYPQTRCTGSSRRAQRALNMKRMVACVLEAHISSKKIIKLTEQACLRLCSCRAALRSRVDELPQSTSIPLLSLSIRTMRSCMSQWRMFVRCAAVSCATRAIYWKRDCVQHTRSHTSENMGKNGDKLSRGPERVKRAADLLEDKTVVNERLGLAFVVWLEQLYRPWTNIRILGSMVRVQPHCGVLDSGFVE